MLRTVDSHPWYITPLRRVTLSWAAIKNGVPHRCPYCKIDLLTGEDPGFCCGPKGSRLHDVSPLPELPPEYGLFINDPSLSKLSRKLNLLFTFAALESTITFPNIRHWEGFMALEGKIYHRIRPSHRDSAVKWLIYDGFNPAFAPYSRHAAQLPPQWIVTMQNVLVRINPFVRALNILGQLPPHLCPTAHVVLEEGTAAELAACLSFDNTSLSQIRPRRMVISRARTAANITVPTVSRLWEPLAYPLLFPHGTLGWGLIGRSHDLEPEPDRRGGERPEWDKATTQMWHYRARLLRESRFEIFGRLTNEYILDMFTRNLECRLKYIRDNQSSVRAADEELMGPTAQSDTANIYLPSSFLGSRRWASEQIADSLAIAAKFGPPTFFITMTCNPQWPEITSRLRPGQAFSDIPVVVCRVFKRKVAIFEQYLRSMFPNSGGVVYLIHVIEFQKRGLPHAHILIKYRMDCVTPSDIDQVISAEMPDAPEDAALIRKHLIHSHGRYCQRKDRDGNTYCRFRYPHRLQDTTTIDAEGRVSYRRRRDGDELVVPHCLPLIRAFQCHINFEAAGPSYIFQYIFKYIHKGICIPRILLHFILS